MVLLMQPELWYSQLEKKPSLIRRPTDRPGWASVSHPSPWIFLDSVLLLHNIAVVLCSHSWRLTIPLRFTQRRQHHTIGATQDPQVRCFLRYRCEFAANAYARKRLWRLLTSRRRSPFPVPAIANVVRDHTVNLLLASGGERLANRRNGVLAKVVSKQ